MRSKISIEQRLTALEVKAKPPVISTLADLVKWASDHEDEDIEVELSPEMQAFVNMTLKHIEEEEGD